jgi:hypothetical protein
MKRDMDLVREILLAVEGNPSGYMPCELKIDGYSEETIAYHTCLLKEADLIDGEESECPAGRQVIPSRLTWAGHEFLDASKEPSRWKEAREAIGKIGGASLTVWTAVLTQIVLKNLSLK